MIKISTVNIIKDLVENWVINLNISSVVVVGSTYKLFTCNTHYLTEQSAIILDEVEFTITSFVNNEYLIVTGDSLPIAGIYQLPAPYFVHGTIIQANEELTLESDCFKKTPMVFLRRPFSETFNNLQQADDRNADITLYFLTQADFASWQIDEYDNRAINPMRNLVNEFIEMLNKNPQINKSQISDYRVEEKIKFGVYVTEKGYEQSVFNDTLSGVMLSLSLPIRKNYTCTC